VVAILDSVGILTELDRSTLAEYCGAYGSWVNLKHELAMLKKIDVDNECTLKDPSRRVEQYRSEAKRWHQAMAMNEKGVVLKKASGEPGFSPYLLIEREAGEKLMKIESTIKREIRDAEDRLLKAGGLIGMSPSSRASLSIHQNDIASKTKDPYEEFLAKKAKK